MIDNFLCGNYHDDYYDESMKVSYFKLPEETEEEKRQKEEAKKYEYTDEEMEQIYKETLPGNKLARIFVEVNKKKDEEHLKKPLPENLKVEGNTFIFTTGTDPVESGRKLYDRKDVIISNDNAITPLVGCNGSGKSTLLHCIHSCLESSGYPVIYWDNLHDGGHNAIEAVAYSNDLAMTGLMLTSSEGENILHNSSKFINLTMDLAKGKYKRNEHLELYRDTDHIFLLLDALDSGFSIDNIHNIKAYFNQIIEEAKKNNKHVYIIVAANSFEVARNCTCWDVQHSKYVEFGTDYEKYRKFIIKSRERILKQWDNMSNKGDKDATSRSDKE